MLDGNGLKLRERRRLIAVQAGARRYPKPSFSIYDHVGHEGVQLTDDRLDYLFLSVIAEKRGSVAEKHVAPGCFHYPGNVAVVAQYLDPFERTCIRTVCQAVHRGDPQPSVTAFENRVDLIVGEAGRIVGTEILVELVYAVFVEAAEGCDPDMSVGIFSEGIDPLVGNAVGYDYAFSILLGNGVLFQGSTSGQNGQNERQVFDSHIVGH